MGTKAQQSLAYQRLPAFLRALREEAGLTQRELGKRQLPTGVANVEVRPVERILKPWN